MKKKKMLDLKKFVGKEIKVYLTNGFFYQGTLDSFDSTGINLDDIKVGITFININSIASIVGNGNN